jgi:hypothetical protein
MPTEETALPFAIGASPFLVKGGVYRGLLTWFDANIPGKTAAVRERLSPALQEFIDQPFLAASQFCYLALFPVCAAAGQELNWPTSRVLRAVAFHVATQDINTVYRFFLKLASPDMLVSPLPRVWKQYFNYGHMEYHPRGPHRFEVQGHGFPTIYAQLFTEVVAGWLEAGFRMTGARESQILTLPIQADGSDRGVPTSTVRVEATWK